MVINYLLCAICSPFYPEWPFVLNDQSLAKIWRATGMRYCEGRIPHKRMLRCPVGGDRNTLLRQVNFEVQAHSLQFHD